MSCTEAAPDDNKGKGTATIEAAQGCPIQHTKATVTEPTMTCLTGHTAEHTHTTDHQVTALRTTVDHIHTHPTNCVIHTTEAYAVQDHTPTRKPKNYTRNRKVHIEEPLLDFYSLDDNSTNSGESESLY